MSMRSSKRSKADQFFDEKRIWSWTKDSVLGTYLKPYLEKVKLRGENILIIEPFAGPGRFRKGEPGSPLIITGIAEKIVPGRYKAIFGNLEKSHHHHLSALLKPLIDRGVVETYNLPAEVLLEKLGPTLGRQTVFLYIDPFGLPPAFKSLGPFLNRRKSFGRHASTEILVNLPPSAIHRVAAIGAADEKLTNQIDSLQRHLSQSLGNGYYWREVLGRTDINAEEQARLVFDEYRSRIKVFLRYSGMCPIREHERAAIKYFMTFFSGHPDSLRLYNDNMRSSLRRGYYNASSKGLALLDGVEPLEEDDAGQVANLKELIVEKLRNGGRESRQRLWLTILDERFLEFSEPSYNKAVKELAKDDNIGFEDVRGTKRLNDDAVLYLKKGRRDDDGGPPPRQPSGPPPEPKARPLPVQIEVSVKDFKVRLPAAPRPKPDGG